jgi:hypothetical protein
MNLRGRCGDGFGRSHAMCLLLSADERVFNKALFGDPRNILEISLFDVERSHSHG